MAGKSTRLREEGKKKQVANAFVAISAPRARSHPSVPEGENHTPTHTHTHAEVLTFPGGDESGQELTEVGAGIGVVQRKSLELGGRASVLVVGLLHRVDVRLQQSCNVAGVQWRRS